MKKLIDANIILRYLLGDHPQMSEEASLDFVDCILIARHRVLGEEIASFDKKLNKMLI